LEQLELHNIDFAVLFADVSFLDKTLLLLLSTIIKRTSQVPDVVDQSLTMIGTV
jgi:hypothetical protein